MQNEIYKFSSQMNDPDIVSIFNNYYTRSDGVTLDLHKPIPFYPDPEKSIEDQLTEFQENMEAAVLKAVNMGMLLSALGVCFCGECKHMMPDGHCDTFADSKICPSVSDFCSYGERKTYRCTQCDDEIPYEGICDKCRKLRGEL